MFKDSNQKDSRQIQEESKIIMLSQIHNSSDRMAKVLASMRHDEISTVVKNDPLIIQFGELLLERLVENRNHEVSQRMR